MNRGVDHQAIFFGDRDRLEFGRLLAECHEEFRLETLAYCLMDNHYHLVVRTPSANLSLAMRHHAATYVRHANDRVGRDGPLFRGRFKSLPVSTPDYLRDVVRYVHRNPLDIPEVGHPAEYRWSSYRTYLGYRRAPRFLDTRRTLSILGQDLPEFAGYTEADRRQRYPDATDLESILGAVRREVEFARLAQPGWKPPRERLVLASLLDHAPEQWRQSIDAHLAFETSDARQKARSRANRRHRDDPHLRELINRVVT
jgi:REP element-mobilizing transposase RayT